MMLNSHAAADMARLSKATHGSGFAYAFGRETDEPVRRRVGWADEHESANPPRLTSEVGNPARRMTPRPGPNVPVLAGLGDVYDPETGSWYGGAGAGSAAAGSGAGSGAGIWDFISNTSNRVFNILDSTVGTPAGTYRQSGSNIVARVGENQVIPFQAGYTRTEVGVGGQAARMQDTSTVLLVGLGLVAVLVLVSAMKR